MAESPPCPPAVLPVGVGAGQEFRGAEEAACGARVWGGEEDEKQLYKAGGRAGLEGVVKLSSGEQSLVPGLSGVRAEGGSWCPEQHRALRHLSEMEGVRWKMFSLSSGIQSEPQDGRTCPSKEERGL